MDLAAMFAEHIQCLREIYAKALAELEREEEAPSIEAMLIHSGSEAHYYADDMPMPFKAFGHFLHWLPVNRPDQMLLFMPGKKPIYFQVVPADFWYEQTVETESWWADQFEIVALSAPEDVMDHLPSCRRIAFLGENMEFALELGLPALLQNEVHLTNYLDFHRGVKSAYEVARLREANQRGMAGHRAAHEAFLDFRGEWEIHQAFLNANQVIEHETPYTNIIGLDEKSAILHYQNKRRRSGRDSRVMLIDAGYRCRGYCSDITRTHVRDHAHPVFRALVEAVNRLELELVGKVRPGVPYVELQEAAHDGVLNILLEHEICHGARNILCEKLISKLFFPHGIGHLLGIQVHDVGGFFKDETGALAPPPEDHQFLRLNRKMLEGMVFTIEPGIYFIPVLLDPERNSEKGQHLNWKLIDELIPLGGVRFEDNLLVTGVGSENLTR